jgi:hypothetical protein
VAARLHVSPALNLSPLAAFRSDGGATACEWRFGTVVVTAVNVAFDFTGYIPEVQGLFTVTNA